MTNPEPLETRTLYENRWVTLCEDRLRRADGVESAYTYILRREFAIIAAIEAGHVWMVDQYRHPLQRRSLELPMGLAPGGPEEMARTELREETGLRAGRMTRIGEFCPAPGLLRQTGIVFLAEDLTEGAPEREASEQDMTACALPIAEVLARAGDGRIQCGVTLAALALLKLRGIV